MAYISNYNEIKIQRWWNTSEHLVSVPDSIHEQVESFKKLFIDAVALRMRSDVSIGACLSGGFDSSAVVCSMDQVAKNSSTHLRQAGNWRNVFVASFPGCSNDESKEALQVARHAKVEPHFFNFQSDNYSVDFNQIINDLDDIYIGIPIAPWMIYAELRKAKCFVSLDGHGADEMMGGYLQKNAKLAFYIKSIISFLSNKSNFISRLVDTIKIVTLNYNKMNFLRNYKLSPPKKIRTPVDKDNYPLKRGLYSNFFYRMFHATTLPTILRNFDRLSMAHGIEIRMPFMDWKLVVFVMSLPDSAKIFSDYNKYIARLAMKNIIPDNIRLEKRKIGFNSPMPELLNGFLGTWVLKQFKNINNEFDKFVDTEELVKEIYFLNLNKAWNWNNAGKLWPYINMKIYMDKYCVN
jgi:asparagine synthase (glutamine-hydrolysing)